MSFNTSTLQQYLEYSVQFSLLSLQQNKYLARNYRKVIKIIITWGTFLFKAFYFPKQLNRTQQRFITMHSIANGYRRKDLSCFQNTTNHSVNSKDRALWKDQRPSS